MPDIVPSQKSWFARPEGKVGAALPIVAAGAAGVGLIYTWGSVLPWIIGMLQNTLTAAALAAGVGAVVVVVADPRWRNLAFYGYKSLMRGLTGLFIEIDPIGILRTYVESLQKKLAEMDSSISSLGGQIKKLRGQIDKNDADRVHSLELAQAAKKRGDDAKNVLVLQSRQAGRLEKSNLTLQNLYDRMTALMGVLKKMREASGLLVEDIKGEVDVKTQERAALLAGYNAFSKARRIMQGGDDQRAIFDMTMDKLTDDYGMKMGEIEQFMDMSKAVIEGVDLDNGIYEEKALAQLDVWEQRSQNLLVSHETSGGTSARFAGIGKQEDQYADLFVHKDSPKQTVSSSSNK
jgi:hypothetical protein